MFSLGIYILLIVCTIVWTFTRPARDHVGAKIPRDGNRRWDGQ